MNRFQGNPILEPIATNAWESQLVFNAAAFYAGDRIHIVYRAMGNDMVSRLGYASSSDGYHIDERLPHPIFEPATAAENDGCEDPRVTIMDGRAYMCYTALENRVVNKFQVALTTIDLKDLLGRNWGWRERWLPFYGIRNKDAALFPRKVNGHYVLLHRVEPDICMAYSDDLRRWCDIKAVIAPRLKGWDCLKVGIAGPPIEVDEGWLLIYHGVDHSRVYSLGVALLDKDEPERVLYRSEKPILEPVEDYERFGKVPNVVFSCGAVRLDDKLLIYYGGADSVLCVATFSINELIPREIPLQVIKPETMLLKAP